MAFNKGESVSVDQIAIGDIITAPEWGINVPAVVINNTAVPDALGTGDLFLLSLADGNLRYYSWTYAQTKRIPPVIYQGEYSW